MAFALGRGYARNSRSQRRIGAKMIRDLVAPLLRDRRSALDLGCGPGTLTAELAAALPLARVTGMDRDPKSLALARRALPAIRFVRGDFRRPPAALKGRFDLVFSNEALHWTATPPSALLAGRFFYRFLPRERAAKYHRWGKSQWRLALTGVASLLAPGGVAVLQFGGHGQLQGLFVAMSRAFDDAGLSKRRSAFRYPTYYPKRGDLARLLAAAGLRPRRMRAWTEPLVEKAPAAIVSFTRAFTEPALKRVLTGPEIERYYGCLAERLRRSRPMIRWRRLLVVAEKRPR